MDDTQQTQQPADTQVTGADAVSSMSDVAGMTPPPPAPVMPEPAAESPAMSASTDMPGEGEGAAAVPGDEDYSYAEDVLNEILDSLDRIEAKLEAMEKKMG